MLQLEALAEALSYERIEKKRTKRLGEKPKMLSIYVNDSNLFVGRDESLFEHMQPLGATVRRPPSPGTSAKGHSTTIISHFTPMTMLQTKATFAAPLPYQRSSRISANETTCLSVVVPISMPSETKPFWEDHIPELVLGCTDQAWSKEVAAGLFSK